MTFGSVLHYSDRLIRLRKYSEVVCLVNTKPTSLIYISQEVVTQRFDYTASK